MFFVKSELVMRWLLRGAWFVEGAVAEHGEQDADAVAGEAEEGLGVGLSPGPAFVVVGAGGGVVQGCEGREEHYAFELSVAASGRVFAVDGGPRRFRGRGEAGVGGQVGGGGEAGAVADGDQQGCGGPGRDPRHRGQDLGKRVCLQQGRDLRFQSSALFVNSGERAGQGRDHDVEGARAGDGDGLLVECVEDLVDQALGHARGLGPDHLKQPASTGFSQRGRGSVAFQQPGDGLVVQARAEDAFQARVELGEQAADPVGGAGGLGRQVLVEADQNGQLGGDLVGQLQRAQGVGHGAGRVGDHGRVLRVGLRLARVEVGDPPHGKSRQVGDLAARIPGHRQRQSPDRGGLVHDHQDGAELRGELVEDSPQLRFAVGQGLVENLLAGRGEPVPVVGALADVQAEEDAHVVDVVQPVLQNRARAVLARASAPYARIHVMQTCRPQAARRCTRPGGSRTSYQRLQRHLPGPGTPPPRSSVRQGGTVMPGPEASDPVAGPRRR